MCLQNILWMVNIVFQFTKFCDKTNRKSVINWYVIGHCIIIMLNRISLLLFNNTLINAILKSCRIPLTIQISQHATSGGFSDGEEKILWQKISCTFWNYFSSTVFFDAKKKKHLYVFWKMDRKIRPLHIIWGISSAYHIYKENDSFFTVNIFLDFLGFYSHIL